MKKLALVRRQKRELQSLTLGGPRVVKRPPPWRVQVLSRAGRLSRGNDPGLTTQGRRESEPRTPRDLGIEAENLGGESKAFFKIIDHRTQRRKQKCADPLGRGPFRRSYPCVALQP